MQTIEYVRVRLMGHDTYTGTVGLQVRVLSTGIVQVLRRMVYCISTVLSVSITRTANSGCTPYLYLQNWYRSQSVTRSSSLPVFVYRSDVQGFVDAHPFCTCMSIRSGWNTFAKQRSNVAQEEDREVAMTAQQGNRMHVRDADDFTVLMRFVR